MNAFFIDEECIIIKFELREYREPHDLNNSYPIVIVSAFKFAQNSTAAETKISTSSLFDHSQKKDPQVRHQTHSFRKESKHTMTHFQAPPVATPVSPTPSYGMASPAQSPAWSNVSMNSPSSPYFMPDSPTSPYSSMSSSYSTPESPASPYNAAYEADEDDFERRTQTPTNQKALALLEQSIQERELGWQNTTLDRRCPKKEIRRLKAANLKALTLMNEQVAGSNFREKMANDGSQEVNYLKSEADRQRQQHANMKALRLLNTTVQKRREYEERMCMSDGDEEYVEKKDMLVRAESVDGMRSNVDTYRQRAAHQRVQELLNRDVAGDKHKPAGATTPHLSTWGASLTAGQAAARAYDLSKHEKRIIKDKIEAESERRRAEPNRVMPRLEKLAESTRKKKNRPLTDDDVRDPETIAGMKCQLDWDREKIARSRALRLLNKGFIW